MYAKVAKDSVGQFMKGFNGTLFAYGQSGSGKTFSMLGPEVVVDAITSGSEGVPEKVQNLYGIIPRAIFDIFQEINQQIETMGALFEIKVNYFEIYNECLNSLIPQDDGSF